MLYFLFFSTVVTAQQPAYISLTEKDGLPDIEFYDILEDSKSFIWLAADKGLFRYNGRRFEHFTNPLQKGNAVFGIKEDSKGRIWCTNVSGQFFYTKNNKLEKFVDLSFELNGELAEFIITDKALIVLPGKNSIKIDLGTKEVTTPFDKDDFIGALETTDDGYLFTKGSYIINATKSLKTIDSLEFDVFGNYEPTFRVQNRVNISANKDIKLCHFLKSGTNLFYKFDIEASRYRLLQIPQTLKRRRIVASFFYDDEVWISTDLGIFVFQINQDRLILQNRLFKDKFVTKVLKDNDSNFWITTKGDGILVIPNVNIFQNKYSKTELNITNLEKFNDTLLIFGTTKGKIGLLNTISLDTEFVSSTSQYNVSDIMSLPSKEEVLIVHENQVQTINKKTKSIRIPNYNSVVIGAKKVSKINDSSFVLSSYKSAIVVDDNFDLKKVLLKKRSYTNYYSAIKKSMFIATVDGLYVFDEILKKKKILFNNQPILVSHITETDNGDIWVSSFSDGIFGIRNNEIFINYTEDSVLLSESISALKADGNDLWVATDKGIQYINTQTGIVKNLTKQDGIPSYRISDIEVTDSTSFFSTNTSVFSVDKNKAFKNFKIPKVYISNVSVGLESVPLKTSYDLDYDDNSIQFSFNANGFQSFINNNYQFRLLGQSNKWQTDNTKSNTISFYSLPSGNYEFQVKSILANEKQTEYIDSVQFVIQKPFWKNWWFYVLVITIIGVTVYAIFRVKIKRLKAQQSIELQKEFVNKQLVLSQLENLRSQMNPHFIFNALNSIQEYIVFNEKELASSYLIKFSRLIRIYLDHSREDEISLSEEIDALNIYLELEKNRFEDILNYHITIDNALNIKDVKIPSLFIQPYVENALKHGLLHKKMDRELYIHFKHDKNSKMLICSIKDNGIGIDASKKINKNRQPNHKSFATSANERRVALLNTNRKHKIQVDILSPLPNQQFGTKVLIQIPLKQ